MLGIKVTPWIAAGTEVTCYGFADYALTGSQHVLTRNQAITHKMISMMIDGFFIFIRLLRESDESAIHRTNRVSLRSCPCFRVFRLNFASDFFNLLLVRFHQAEVIVVKHLIQERNNG